MAVVATVGDAQLEAMKQAVTWTAGFVVAGVLVATFLPGRRRRTEPSPPGRPRAALK